MAKTRSSYSNQAIMNGLREAAGRSGNGFQETESLGLQGKPEAVKFSDVK
jgi:hypothetical protein